MKKKFSIDWLSLLLIIVFASNTILSIFLFADEQNIFNLISLILYPCGLAFFVFVLIFVKVYQNKRYLIIYNDYFEIYDKSIFDAKLICEHKNKKYLKYGLTSINEKKYEFSHNGLIVHFGLIDIDENRKLMIIYKINNEFYESFSESIDKAREYYYDNNEICLLEGENIFYKNKRNAFQIKEINSRFIVIKYRHYLPIEIYSIKTLSNRKVGWEYIGDSHDDGIEYFETDEKAKEYILSLNIDC